AAPRDPGAGPATAAPSPAALPSGDTGTLTVGQSGTASTRTIWYVRIESMAAKPLVEKGFPGQPIALTQALEPGRYRVISWYRTCQSVCPTSGEQGLGPLEQVCGAQVTVAKGERVTATVKITADGCSIEVE
ncbi:MAG: hypothetical protein ACRDT4_11325, partial [Micromonosporaceae bacterium]